MSDFELIVTTALVHLGAVVSPGPDFLIVSKHALSYSRNIGVYTALGIGCAIIIHVSYSFLGIGILIQESPLLFKLLKIISAAYIFYLGIVSLRSNSSNKNSKSIKVLHSMSPFKAFRIGFVTNALNVKATLFFVGLLAAIIKSNTNKEIWFVLAILIIIQTTLWFVLVAHFFSKPKIQSKYYSYENIINKLFGLLLISLAIKILFF